MVISPGTKELALGRGHGHIEVFGNVFENVANYFDPNIAEEDCQ